MPQPPSSHFHWPSIRRYLKIFILDTIKALVQPREQVCDETKLLFSKLYIMPCHLSAGHYCRFTELYIFFTSSSFTYGRQTSQTKEQELERKPRYFLSSLQLAPPHIPLSANTPQSPVPPSYSFLSVWHVEAVQYHSQWEVGQF